MEQSTQVAVQGSLRDVLRALEREEHDMMPLSGIRSGASTALRENVREAVSQGEQRSPVSLIGPGAQLTALLSWRDRIDLRATGMTALAFGIAAPVTVMLFAGALLIAPPPQSDWARAALNEVGFEDAGPSLPVAAASAPSERGVQAFAMLGRRVLAAGLAAPLHVAAGGYSLSARHTIEARPGETVPLPFAVAGADRLPPGSKLIVRGMPEFAALSSAEPQADGSWALPIERARDAKLTAYALPNQQGHELVAELRSGDELLDRATARLMPRLEAPLVAPAVVTAPPAGASAPGGPIPAEPPIRSAATASGVQDGTSGGQQNASGPLPAVRPDEPLVAGVVERAEPRPAATARALPRALPARRPAQPAHAAPADEDQAAKAPLLPWSRSALGFSD